MKEARLKSFSCLVIFIEYSGKGKTIGTENRLLVAVRTVVGKRD